MLVSMVYQYDDSDKERRSEKKSGKGRKGKSKVPIIILSSFFLYSPPFREIKSGMVVC